MRKKILKKVKKVQDIPFDNLYIIPKLTAPRWVRFSGLGTNPFP